MTLIIDSHAHLEPRMLPVETMVQKLDAAGVQKVVLIPALNDPLPPSPERLLSLLRTAMRSAATRPLAEAIHRSTMADGAIRFPSFPLPQNIPIYPRPNNDAVATLLQQCPTRFLGWIFLNPAADPDVLATLERYRHIPGFIGVKLHPHWHDYRTEILGPLLRRCEELRLPVLIHLGFGKRGDFRHLADTFPRLPLIAAHAGFPFYDDLWAVQHACPNLYVDLSSPYIDEPLARAAVKAMGPERCIYGTDAPYGTLEEDGSYDYGAIRGWVERLPIHSREREAIFSTNLLSLIEGIARR